MAHKSGFIDYRLEGSKVTWRHSPRGTKVALVSERDIRSDKRLGCLSAVFFFVGGAWGFARLFY